MTPVQLCTEEPLLAWEMTHKSCITKGLQCASCLPFSHVPCASRSRLPAAEVRGGVVIGRSAKGLVKLGGWQAWGISKLGLHLAWAVLTFLCSALGSLGLTPASSAYTPHSE